MIVTTHPIQYQTPIFRELARRNRVPFEVVFLCDHGARKSYDRELGVSFSWDVSLLEGYRSSFASKDRSPTGFWSLRLPLSHWLRLRSQCPAVVWIQGWQVAGYWQATLAAKLSGAQLWLRAESNSRSGSGRYKLLRAAALRALFYAVDRFLCIGSANRDFYVSYGVAPNRLASAPYCVENERFRAAASTYAPARDAIRSGWGVAADAFVFLFVGKFVAKKRPLDILAAAAIAARHDPARKIHLLWVGAGELESSIRADAASVAMKTGVGSTFVGFLNQSEIGKAYCAADCLILPSGSDETWGLVVNEAMASGRPALISDACGCAQNLALPGRDDLIFRCGDSEGLARSMAAVMARPPGAEEIARKIAEYEIGRTVDAVEELYAALAADGAA